MDPQVGSHWGLWVLCFLYHGLQSAPSGGVGCLLLRVVSVAARDRGWWGFEAFYISCLFCCFCLPDLGLLSECAGSLSNLSSQ